MKTFGILLRLDWNSNNWKEEPTSNDLTNSNFSYVKDNNKSCTYMNFNRKELLHNNFKYLLAPPLVNKTPQEDVKICIFVSQKESVNYLVGYVLFPDLKNRRNFEGYPPEIKFNVRSIPEHNFGIEPIELNVEKYLPNDKKFSRQGFNYINRDKSIKLLSDAGIKSFPMKFIELF
jgi:hypothetical protein